jgi:2'-5' RNA ligase
MDTKKKIIESLLFLNEDSVSKETKQTGVMVALYPPKELVEKLAIKGGVPVDEMHVTLGYLGKLDDISNLDELKDTVSAYSKGKKPMKGTFGGIGRFNGSETSGGKDVLYASLDLPDLPEFRQGLVEVLDKNDTPVSKIHGYTPHMTLTYFPSDSKLPVDRIETTEVTFDTLYLVLGEKKIGYSLK